MPVVNVKPAAADLKTPVATCQHGIGRDVSEYACPHSRNSIHCALVTPCGIILVNIA